MVTKVPYRFVDWDEPFDVYVKHLQQFVLSTNILNTGTFLNPFKATDVFTAIPSLQKLLEKYSLNDLRSVAIIKALPSHVAQNYPHVDVTPSSDHNIALNWPVFNCEETFTCFYKPKPGAQPELLQLRNGLNYSRYQFDMVEETHRIKIQKPVALRVDMLHSVINDTQDVRVSASFRFNTNHWELFNG